MAIMNDSLEIDETAKYIEKFINCISKELSKKKSFELPNNMYELMNLIFDLRYKLYDLSQMSGNKYKLAINKKEFEDALIGSDLVCRVYKDLTYWEEICMANNKLKWVGELIWILFNS